MLRDPEHSALLLRRFASSLLNVYNWHQMFTINPVAGRRLALALLLTSALVALVGPLWEAGQRAPEATVRAYLDNVGSSHLEDALDAVAPSVRPAARERVQNQLGNHYRLELVALGNPSLLARALGTSRTTARATILAEVTPLSGESWKSTTVVRLVDEGGRWYLLDPPFA